MRDLVPLKVKIGLKSDGQARYPNFNAIVSSIRHGMDWSKFVDTYGTGWHYDKVAGHKEEDAESPYGVQYGCILVPKDFADAALAMFPGDIEKLTEVQFEGFYNFRHTVRMAEEIADEDILRLWEMKEKAGINLTQLEKDKKAKALDPSDSTPGIRKNPKKYWADYKATKGVNIVQ